MVELMIVVAIIALLVAMAMPLFSRIRMASLNTAAFNDLRQFANAFERYGAETGEFPPDAMPGVLPPGMEPYISPGIWQKRTPLGGQYDWDAGVYPGIRYAVSITGATLGADQLLEFDRRFDDGQAGTGRVRILGNTIVLVIEQE